MNTELCTSQIKDYNLTLNQGESVVRNYRRVAALIEARESHIPEKYRGLLATPTFCGGATNESITWSTDVFTHPPVVLSALPSGEQVKYRQILNESLRYHAMAIKSASEDTISLIRNAITYQSEDSIYCGEGRVVITDWAMRKKGLGQIIGLPIFVETDVRDQSDSNDLDKIVTSADVGSSNDVHTSDNNLTSDTFPNGDGKNDSENSLSSSNSSSGISSINESRAVTPSTNGNSDTVIQKDNGASDDNTGGTSPQGNPLAVGNASNSDSDRLNDSEGKDKSKNGIMDFFGKARRWLLLILLFLLLFFIILCIRACRSPLDGIEKEQPIAEEEIGMSKDEMTHEVTTRFNVIVSSGGSLEDFVRDFKKQYKEDQCKLVNPDTLTRRVTVITSKEERDSLMEELPKKFPQYNLIIIPETLFKGSAMSSDPGMSVPKQRWYFDMCSVFDAWDVTMGDEDIVVAVIDDGFDLNHPEIKGKIVRPFNAVKHNTNIFPSKDGHGMHVAATAVGIANNGAGTAGIAPKCKLMPIQVADEKGRMAMSSVIDGVLYAINNGADVVNMSLGMYFGNMVQYFPVHIQKQIRENSFPQEEIMWKQIFDYAERNNVTFVLAGGNENIIIGIDPMGRSHKTIKVSAVRPDKYKANFSNFGDMSTLSAPGVDIYNAIPGNRYTFMNGTSMASPIVAGGCALLKSQDRSLTTSQIIQRLRETGLPSPSDVGPIVNFARALDYKGDDGVACDSIGRRYQELLAELEKLRREHPDCCEEPDTMKIPEGATLVDISGRWMSTTPLYNTDEEKIVIYFHFNGTAEGKIEFVEPSGNVYYATTGVSIKDDVVYIDQNGSATSSSVSGSYQPYSFVCKPGKNRQADCNGVNKKDDRNRINFSLVRI